MNITSAKFVKGFVNPSDIAQEELPQYAFIGRSNVGKSSLINTITKQKGLAKTSSFPGRTQQINLFLINNKFHLVDLPGYGFARISAGGRDTIFELIRGYIFGDMPHLQKVVLIIDGVVGPTRDDMDMLEALEHSDKNILIAVNKTDKLKKNELKKQLEKIQNQVGAHKMMPISAEKKIGIGELQNELFTL
jgi:GTP-binding protein